MITVFGSTNLDQIGTVFRFPIPGETVAGRTFSMMPGGKGANQALAARRAGARVRHVSAVGEDAFADIALALLDRDGVDLSFVRVAQTVTGTAMITVDARGENIIAIFPGANGALGPQDAEQGLETLGRGDVLLLQQEVPQEATLRALEIARKKGARSILNIAPFLPDTTELALLADIVVANETEFALLSGRSIENLNDDMTDWVCRSGKAIVVTLGAKGAHLCSQEGILSAPAPEIVVLDTVGAGDTFCGYFAAALDSGASLEKALARATMAGSLACLSSGAQPSIPMAGEVEHHMKSHSSHSRLVLGTSARPGATGLPLSPAEIKLGRKH